MATPNSTPTTTTNKPARTRQPKPTPASSLTASRGGAAPILGSVPATTAATPIIVPTLTPAHLPPLVIDRNDTGNYTTRHGRYDPTEIEGDLIRFLVDGELPIMEHDAPKAVAYMMGEGGGATLADVFTSSLKYRAARRQLCANLARYIEAVNEDEARRDKAKRGEETVPSVTRYYDRADVRRELGDCLTPEVIASAIASERRSTFEEEQIIRSLRQGSPVNLPFEEVDYIKDRLREPEDNSVESVIAEQQKERDDRRAFYEEVKRFINDTATWAALDAPAPDIAAIAAEMGVADSTETPTEEPTGKTEARATADNLLHELDGLFGKITRMSDAGGGKICLESEALEEITSDFSDALPDLTGSSNNSMYSIIAAILYGNSFSDYAARVGPSIARDTAEWTLSIGQVYLRAMATGNTYVTNLLHLVNAYAAKEMDSGDEE